MPNQLLNSIKWAAIAVAALWCLMIALPLFGIDSHQWAVYPRHTHTLWRILTAPLVHGSVGHLASNSMALLILGAALLYGYPKSRFWVLLLVWIGSGLGVWVFGRSAYHLGASGITHGLFFYLFFVSLFRRDRRSIALMMIAFFLYGGMLMTIFPRDPEISFEYHLFGGLTGLACALMFKRWDPMPERKKYDWEGEKEDDDEEPYWLETDSSSDKKG